MLIQNDKKTFGFKINAQYKKGDEFSLDPDEDADFLAQKMELQPRGYFNQLLKTIELIPHKFLAHEFYKAEIDPDGMVMPI